MEAAGEYRMPSKHRDGRIVVSAEGSSSVARLQSASKRIFPPTTKEFKPRASTTPSSCVGGRAVPPIAHRRMRRHRAAAGRRSGGHQTAARGREEGREGKEGRGREEWREGRGRGRGGVGRGRKGKGAPSNATCLHCGLWAILVGVLSPSLAFHPLTPIPAPRGGPLSCTLYVGQP